DPAGDLRAGGAPAVGGVGRAAVPRDPSARGARRRAERDGERAAPASAAGDLRARRGCRALRVPRRTDGAARACRRPRDLGVLLRPDHARALGSRHPGAHRGRAGTYPVAMSAFPVTRLRRLRRTGALRDLVRETPLSLDDLVQPLFVAPEALPNPDLPALARYTVDGIVAECEELVRLGVRAVILFGIPEDKDEEGSGAWIEDGIVQRALRALRPRFPELVLFTDVCLCEYTSHGHCGVLENGDVDNDASLELLTRTAVSHVEAGAD